MKSPLFNTLKFLLKISISISFLLILTECTTTYDMPTAKNIDINKYMGKWIEIARIETPFQKGKFDSIAEYNLNSNNTVSIINTATSADGKRATASAVAYNCPAEACIRPPARKGSDRPRHAFRSG